MRVTIINPNSNLFGQSGEGSKLGSGNYTVTFKSGHEFIFSPSEIELVDQPPKDEWVQPPKKDPVRKARGLFGWLRAIFSGKWKGD